MTKSIEKLNCINGSGTFQSDDLMHSSTSDRCRPMRSNLLESKFVDLQVFRQLRRACRDVEHGSVGICCLLETRFGGKSEKLVGKQHSIRY